MQVQRIEERLSALGNVIACNDHVALIHTELVSSLLNEALAISSLASTRDRLKHSSNLRRICYIWFFASSGIKVCVMSDIL